ncbi:MAG: DnaJ domain-containing protein [Candidatus Saccharibacteria bacterium]|nr:DnaJ domain-containing protein [Microbacteriaceae bacterium]
MSDSPISATPYEVLGVSSTATQDDLRRAYRRLVRETHPDTGGDAERFTSVQVAGERGGGPDDRAVYDRGRPTSRGADTPATWAPQSRPKQTDTRPRARSYGHPGGWRRERYLVLMREWVGRGEPLEDPYDPSLVRSAPMELRHLLAGALAEEATARALAALGIGYTIWHDVSTGDPEEKIDHVVLGPTGVFAILSEDYGEPVRSRRGELLGKPLGEARPMHDLGVRAKIVSRAARVKFTALLIVLPDDALDEPYTVLGVIRGAATVIARRSMLPVLLRDGVPGTRVIGGNELFDVRTRLQGGIHFV